MLRENVINNEFKPNSRRRRKTEMGVSILNLEKLQANTYTLYFCSQATGQQHETHKMKKIR